MVGHSKASRTWNRMFGMNRGFGQDLVVRDVRPPPASVIGLHRFVGSLVDQDLGWCVDDGVRNAFFGTL